MFDPSLIVEGVISGLLIGGVYSLLAIGLTIIFGVLGVINFAHGELMMIAMYVTLVISNSFQVQPYFAFFLVLPLLFLFGVFIQKFLIQPVLDAPPDIQVLITLGLSIALQNIALLIWGPNYQSLQVSRNQSVIHFLGYVVSVPRLLAFIGALTVSGLLLVFLKKSNLGKAIRACADNREGALLIGIRVERVFLVTFGIGAACAGVAGVFIMPFFYTSPHIGLTFILISFVVAILGGLGKIEGALVGGLIIGVVESLGGILADESIKQIITFSLFIIILFFKPSGLFGKKLR
ncbi:MAG: branched-chain amino acid ABC transporter permease [Deltaproteobacteria bacterium]|nr:branched-chain amino acid ABC transporter permease [Deltaproteobacteria bacterium]MBW2044749.1 branched-chain amino acid ABC transporter permease [Deltaproteobacteria bacterium]MBW2301712.1 branched-chain amino acid ABC transporter permease [Deltaproteobacteria bacterium]